MTAPFAPEGVADVTANVRQRAADRIATLDLLMITHGVHKWWPRRERATLLDLLALLDKVVLDPVTVDLGAMDAIEACIEVVLDPPTERKHP